MHLSDTWHMPNAQIMDRQLIGYTQSNWSLVFLQYVYALFVHLLSECAWMQLAHGAFKCESASR